MKCGRLFSSTLLVSGWLKFEREREPADVKRIIGHRGARESDWLWADQVERRPGWEKPRFPAYPAIVAVLFAALSLALLAWITGFGGGGGDPDGKLAEGAAEGTAAPGSPGFEEPLAVQVLGWTEGETRWLSGDLALEEAGYRPGESIPLLLRIDNARVGSSYTVAITYDCAYGSFAAFDYLTRFDRNSEVSIVNASPGPGRSPDSAEFILDDPGIPYDDLAPPQTFQAWGASFAEPASPPTPEGACSAGKGQYSEKQVLVRLRAASKTVWLLWGLHLASPEDWGPGKDFGSVSGRIVSGRILKVETEARDGNAVIGSSIRFLLSR